MKLQKIEKDLWYVCTRNEYTGDYPDGDLTFKEGFAYKGEDILKEYSEDEIQKYYLRSFRLWTVQDAKPGDFLTYRNEDHTNWYFIYHSEYKPYESHYHYYAGYAEEFLTGGTACLDEDYLRPSTPQEKELLLSKIKENGYIWDAENLKLINTSVKTVEKEKMTDEEVIIKLFGEFEHKAVKDTGFVYGYIRQVIRNFLNGFEELGNNYFKWEVVHIIDKAMKHKDDGVKAYARKLADKYYKEGHEKFADAVLSAIGEKEVPMATMDSDHEKMKVVTLCGSTRFKEQFLEQQKRLTLEGNVVISVGLFGHSGDEEVWKPGTKEMLDKMHLQKIDMADEIFVINVGGYIGESTRREIAYAESKGKIVKYLEYEKDQF